MLASGLTPFAMAPSLLQVVTIIVAVAQVASRAASYPWTICGNSSTFIPNSKYQANLNLMATTLPGNASTSPSNLFATAVAGAAPDQVWAAGLCRGDMDASSCFSCLTQAFDDLPNDCSYIKDATIFYDPCILRYSSSRILSAADTDASGRAYTLPTGRNVTSEKVQFNRVVAALINATADYAAHNSTLRFAAGEARFNLEVPKVYAVVQCTPNQTPEQCRRCLAGIISKNLGDCENSVGCRLLWISCSYRYEIKPFFNGQGMVQLDLASSNSSGVPRPAHAPNGQPPVGTLARGAGNNRRKVLIIALAGSLSALFTVLLGCVLAFTRLRRQGYKRPQVANTSKTEEALKLWRTEESSSEFTLYDFTELASATANFSVQNRLGRGGFGPVYKGLLRDGMEIAVKRLSTQSLQGLVEFKNEIQLIAKLQHTNLVRLLGCCVQEEEKMLVYEYMPNGSLDFHIFDSERGRLLNWKKRLHIIEGIALGLLYLHKHSRVRIIHRDLKASNILLDKDLNPKISDFGMARIFSPNITKANTNRVVGTYGYMAPEYASEGIFSVRSDVFSFGVLLLEILCAKKNSSNHQHYGGFINLIGYAWQMWSEGRAVELIDPVLMGNFDDMESILSCIKVALLCVQKETMDRPTMTEVITMLGTEGPPLKDPNQPPYFHLRVDDDDTGGEDRWEAESRPQLLGAFSTNNVTFSIIEEGR